MFCGQVSVIIETLHPLPGGGVGVISGVGRGFDRGVCHGAPRRTRFQNPLDFTWISDFRVDFWISKWISRLQSRFDMLVWPQG